jgi:hypothetical protein
MPATEDAAIMHPKGGPPLGWHYFYDINEAVKAVRAADRLDIPFVMHVR